MKIKGTVEYKSVGMGAWALVSEDGTTYELYQPSAELKQKGLSVEIEGKIRKDIMTIAMIGDVLEVISWQPLK